VDTEVSEEYAAFIFRIDPEAGAVSSSQMLVSTSNNTGCHNPEDYNVTI
jgi:hypothetical protein